MQFCKACCTMAPPAGSPWRFVLMRAFTIFLVLIFVALASIGLLTYPAWLLLHPHFDFPFHRIGERIAMLIGLVGFVILAPRMKLGDRVSLGYGIPRRRFAREFLL